MTEPYFAYGQLPLRMYFITVGRDTSSMEAAVVVVTSVGTVEMEMVCPSEMVCKTVLMAHITASDTSVSSDITKSAACVEETFN